MLKQHQLLNTLNIIKFDFQTNRQISSEEKNDKFDISGSLTFNQSLQVIHAHVSKLPPHSNG